MVLAEVFLCKFPELLVEGSGEHHVAVIIILIHVFFKSAKPKRIIARQGGVKERAPWQTFSITYLLLTLSS